MGEIGVSSSAGVATVGGNGSSNNRNNNNDGLIRLTNGRLVVGDRLVEGEDVWISSQTGRIVDGRQVFFELGAVASTVIDLQGRIVAPGMIDVQINGAFNLDFSRPKDVNTYAEELERANQGLVSLGVTSYLPTLTTSSSQVYHEVLPFLGPSAAQHHHHHQRDGRRGAESLGAHCEGPFMSPVKNGIHKLELVQSAPAGWADFEACYGRANLEAGYVKMITAAPEVGAVRDTIARVTQFNTNNGNNNKMVFSIGHTEATYEQACDAVARGATMVTHLFNAMTPLHHRDPGVVGLLSSRPSSLKNKRPYYGLIADGIHLHPATVQLAAAAHPDGCILVTDAMHLTGMADGVYDWTNGDRIVKKGPCLTLERAPEKIAGSAVTLLECVNNFRAWTDATIPQALSSVTEKPAKMLGLYPQKGSLAPGADADLVILDEIDSSLRLNRVFKFGQLVFEAS